MMLLNPYRFAASGGGGSAHRYWRWTGFAWSGDRVEISELRVVNGSTPIAADMTSSSSPSYYGLYYLTDGSFGSGCTWWSPAGLWIVADLGSAQEVTGMQIGAVDTPERYPTDITLQWSDDNSSWTTFGTWSGLTYPGNYTAGPVLTPSGGGGSAHRYWRWINIAVDGGYLEISELRVVNGSTPLSVAAATAATAPAGGTSGSGVVADLMDGSTSTRTYWTAAAAEDSGFWIRADLGSAQTVTGMQLGAFDTADRYPTDITLQWSDDDSAWTTFGTWSGLTYPGNYTAGPVLTPPAHVTSGLVFMLDPEGYSSGQVWGSAPYDFNLGATSSAEGSDPTHSGTYWTFDGGDYFTAASAATTFLKGMHKAGSEWTIEAWWYSAGDGGNVNPIFDSGTVDGGGSDTSRGVIFGDLGYQVNPQNRWGVRVKQDSGGGSSLNAYLSEAPAANTWHHHAVSFTGGAGSFLWLDGAVAASNLGATTWDGTLSSPGTTDPANPARIGARGDVAFRVANGSRLGILRIYDRALTQTEMLQNWNADRATYGL